MNPQRVRVSAAGLGTILAIGMGVMLAGCEREPTPGEDDSPASAAAPAEADEAVRNLSDRFKLRVRDEDDPASLIPEAERLVERYPEHAAAHRLLGQMRLSAGSMDSAYAHFEKSLELEPGQAELHLLSGTIAKQQDDLKAAERHYSEAVSIEPNNGRARMHLAQLLIDQQRYDEARRELLMALARDASQHEAHAMMADLYAKQNRIEPALTHIRKALDLLAEQGDLTESQRERWVVYVRRRAMLLRRDLKPEAALSVLNDLPDKLRFEPAMSEEIARCWAMMQQPIKAAEHFAEAVERHPTSADAMIGAARWYLRADRPSEARRMVDRLQRLNPRHPQVTVLREQLQADNQKAPAEQG